jgi:hypothetical protein
VSFACRAFYALNQTDSHPSTTYNTDRGSRLVLCSRPRWRFRRPMHLPLLHSYGRRLGTRRRSSVGFSSFSRWYTQAAFDARQSTNTQLTQSRFPPPYSALHKRKLGLKCPFFLAPQPLVQPIAQEEEEQIAEPEPEPIVEEEPLKPKMSRSKGRTKLAQPDDDEEEEAEDQVEEEVRFSLDLGSLAPSWKLTSLDRLNRSPFALLAGPNLLHLPPMVPRLPLSVPPSSESFFRPFSLLD